jgi:hypothetical protein
MRAPRGRDFFIFSLYESLSFFMWPLYSIQTSNVRMTENVWNCTRSSWR